MVVITKLTVIETIVMFFFLMYSSQIALLLLKGLIIHIEETSETLMCSVSLRFFSLLVDISKHKLADFPPFHCLCFQTKASVVLSSYACIPLFIGLCRQTLFFPVISLSVCKIFRIPHSYYWHSYVADGIKNSQTNGGYAYLP